LLQRKDMPTVAKSVSTLAGKRTSSAKASTTTTSRTHKPLSPGIVKIEGVCGGNACIMRTRIPVWSIIEWQQMGVSTAKILKIYPTLTASDLLSAELYYKHNASEIDEAIRENQEA